MENSCWLTGPPKRRVTPKNREQTGVADDVETDLSVSSLYYHESGAASQNDFSTLYEPDKSIFGRPSCPVSCVWSLRLKTGHSVPFPLLYVRRKRGSHSWLDSGSVDLRGVCSQGTLGRVPSVARLLRKDG